ncbi:hypothetical protein E0H73_06775 [Kribbella pittospori]|uniref:LysM domain-containing protein n=1 Tax=Kribbella pittospori TaxID=722689 RepID=A0A4R0KWS7_9ACTN|nr:hypothetical protein [Kribbella pittospori]TCC64124.1 hypothetical protein E0H73_06775 [Kribbella pittospori]
MTRGVKGAFTLTALAGVGLGLRWATAGSIGAASSRDLDSMAVLAVGTVAWVAYGWLVLAMLATVLEQLPGVAGAAASAIAGRITSRTARTLLRSALGVAAVTPLTLTTAHADPVEGTARPWTQVEPRSTVQPEAQSPARVGVPDRPTAGAPTRYTTVRSGRPVRVVRPGESLWRIAADELGASATDAEIAGRWPDWYGANRRLIGSDPDLIHPGQVLHTPPTSQEN